VHVWDLDSKKEVVKLLGHQTKCTSLVSNGVTLNELVTGSEDTKIKVWDTRTAKCILNYREHTGRINTVQLSPDAKWVASGSEDGTVKIWELNSGKTLANFGFPG
jgi:katanin p80 WD40 repeat-containing subunit B1